MNEDLVGYLLGALDRDAAEKVEKQLSEKSSLRRELDRIGWALRPLSSDAADVDPPPRLAERTIRRVMRFRQPESWAVAPSGQWRFTDLAVAAGILLVISLIILPALSESRQQRAIVDCCNNMRNLGVAMETYAERFGGYLPFYSSGGPLGIAGIYSPIFLETRLVTDPSIFICPGSRDDPSAIASLSELRLAQDDVQRLGRLSRSAGGSYGSLLGFFDGETYRAPRVGRLPGQSVLADRGLRPGEGDVARSNSPNHAGRGQNVLQRDGSVKFLNCPRECPGCDDFYVNRHNQVGPGLGPTDMVFGASEAKIGPEAEKF